LKAVQRAMQFRENPNDQEAPDFSPGLLINSR
jgi:hypothetical protein